MNIEAARVLIPVRRRLDWPVGHLRYVDRRAYGEHESRRMRLLRRLKSELRRFFGTSRRLL